MRYPTKQIAAPDLQKLNHFLLVAELGSFTKAAAVLNIAQSALSRQIRELEQEFGDRLFHRTGRGVLPTEFGQQILPRVRALLLQAEQLTEDIKASRGIPQGQVTLAMLASLSPLLLTPLLSRIMDRFPGIQMRVLEGLTEHVEEWLAAGRVDLGILYGDRRNPSVADELLMSAELYLVAKKGDQVAASETLPLHGISDLAMILPALPNRWRLSIERACAEHQIPLSVTFELDSIQTIKDLVALGKRYSVLPLHAVYREVNAGILQISRLVDPTITREIFLASSTQRPRSRASSEVAKVTHALVAEMVHSGQLPGRL